MLLASWLQTESWPPGMWKAVLTIFVMITSAFFLGFRFGQWSAWREACRHVKVFDKAYKAQIVNLQLRIDTMNKILDGVSNEHRT